MPFSVSKVTYWSRALIYGNIEAKYSSKSKYITQDKLEWEKQVMCVATCEAPLEKAAMPNDAPQPRQVQSFLWRKQYIYLKRCWWLVVVWPWQIWEDVVDSTQYNSSNGCCIAWDYTCLSKGVADPTTSGWTKKVRCLRIALSPVKCHLSIQST